MRMTKMRVLDKDQMVRLGDLEGKIVAGHGAQFYGHSQYALDVLFCIEQAQKISNGQIIVIDDPEYETVDSDLIEDNKSRWNDLLGPMKGHL